MRETEEEGSGGRVGGILRRVGGGSNWTRDRRKKSIARTTAMLLSQAFLARSFSPIIQKHNPTPMRGSGR